VSAGAAPEAAAAHAVPVAPIRHLGRFRLITVGLNSVIGGGIFILPATVAALVGSASLAAYVAAGTVVLGVGAALGRLAAGAERSGGPYLYVERAFGPFAGFQVGWLFCLARLTALANLLNGAALYLGALLPALREPVQRAVLILAFAAAIVAIDVVGIRRTSGASTFLAIAKVGPLFLLGLAGLLDMEPGRLVPGAVEPASFLRAVLLLVFAFTGFEVLTVPAEESHRPGSDIPFALVATIGIVCALYLLVHSAALGALPDLGRETAPLATLAGTVAGEGARTLMTGFGALSMVGCGLISLFGADRLLYAMSSAGRIPAFLGALHPGTRTPLAGTLLTGGLGATLAIVGVYASLAAVSSGTRLLVYLVCCLASLKTRAAGGRLARGVSLLTTGAILVLLTGLQRREVVFGMMGIGAGLGLYLIARRQQRGAAPHGDGT
jgi:APA family basic amino acid/polyamine antiporter